MICKQLVKKCIFWNKCSVLYEEQLHEVNWSLPMLPQYLFTLCQHIKKNQSALFVQSSITEYFSFTEIFFFFFFWHRTLKNNIWRRCTKLVNNIPVHFSQISGQFHALEVPSVGISTDKQPYMQTHSCWYLFVMWTVVTKNWSRPTLSTSYQLQVGCWGKSSYDWFSTVTSFFYASVWR